jgi:hypothetical protein
MLRSSLGLSRLKNKGSNLNVCNNNCPDELRSSTLVLALSVSNCNPTQLTAEEGRLVVVVVVVMMVV